MNVACLIIAFLTIQERNSNLCKHILLLFHNSALKMAYYTIFIQLTLLLVSTIQILYFHVLKILASRSTDNNFIHNVIIDSSLTLLHMRFNVSYIEGSDALFELVATL